jgi:hypothetical protein
MLKSSDGTACQVWKTPLQLLSVNQGMTLKVSGKGGVSVYGLGRFPVTLYKEQWEKLLGMTDDIHTFITKHEAELKTKE